MGRSFGLASSSLVVVCPVSRTPNGGKPVTRFSCLKKDSRRGPTAGRVRFSRPWMTGHIQESYKGLNRLEEEALLGRKFLRTLLIDNYDSYTYNIYQELSVVNGVPPVVVYNDEWTWEYLYHCLYEEKCFDNIVISPGPGSPMCPKDIGLCLRVLLECKEFPILGVCLGHQALGYVHGAQVIHAPEPVHGCLSEIQHNGCSLFHDIPSGSNSGFKVVRYHSLVLDPDSLPKELIPIAWTCSANTLSFQDSEDLDAIPNAVEVLSDGFVSVDHIKGDLKNGRLSHPKNFEDSRRVLMGIMHSSWPHYGVQFHPESIATFHGRKIFENFKKITVDYWSRSSRINKRKEFQGRGYLQNSLKSKRLISNAAMNGHLYTHEKMLNSCKSKSRYLKLQWKKLDGLASEDGDSRKIFCELFGSHNAEDTFWLDSSSLDKRRARFSFMGGKGGLLWKQITFRLLDQRGGGYLTTRDAQGSTKSTFLEDGLLDFVDKELRSFHYEKEDYEGLPFDFCGGYIGFIGYDLKVECGVPSNRHKSKTPDACFFFADNLLVVDHSNGDVYILYINDAHHRKDFKAGCHENTRSWLEKTEERLLGLEAQATKELKEQNSQIMTSVMSNFGFVFDKSKDQYIEDVEKCLKLIEDGESYELCLTTQMRKKLANKDFLKFYLNLRDQNPSPYAAWLNFSKENLCICCSSPERFLRLDGNGMLEAKPIKGTVARGKTSIEDRKLRFQLQHSEKDQAENLMIVDLLRNDLGRVCEPGSVHVPCLMEVESYATVHTLVSTIQGKKRSNLSPIDCVKAAFPGGSMTGAPKLRSMELLDSIEGCSRGIYSGSIGFFSYNQTFDLNIVIRTVIINEGEASIGAGGAVVALSNPQDEHQEMLLKARAPARTLMEHENSCNHPVESGTDT